jgi:hypothetical protein
MHLSAPTNSDGKSVTGVVIMLCNAPIYVKSGKQKIVTKSSTESEFVAISDSLSQILWSREFLMHQHVDIGPAILFQDNKSTIFVSEKGRSTSERTRHIKVRFFSSIIMFRRGKLFYSIYLPRR